ncbi:hypothetical protein LVJ94_37540 [Pendulispora rubella]|uniref:Uncharacterized protein n=1 Tax=Pendulispora rubella TaxID=2741070 RepID=A0ABZ2L1Y1_9BACT
MALTSIRGSTAVLGAFALSWLAGEGHAAADEPPRVRLVYVRGPGTEKCPDERDLRNGVAARLGRDPFDDHAERMVTARVSRARKILRARIEVHGPAGELYGERELSSKDKDCAELAEATELAIAIAIDPLGAMSPKPIVTEAPPTAPAPVDEPHPPPAPPPQAPARVAEPLPPPPPPPARPHLQFHAEGGPVGSLGAGPQVAVGGRLLVGLRRAPLSLGLEGRLDAPTTRSVGPGSIETSLMLAALVPCYHYSVLAGCAILGAGALQSHGRSFDDSRDATTAVFMAGARLAVEVPLDGVLFLHLHSDLLAALSQTSVQVNQSEVWQTPRISGVLGMGLGVTFP